MLPWLVLSADYVNLFLDKSFKHPKKYIRKQITTTMTSDQPTLLDYLNQASLAAQIEVSWGLAYLTGPYWMTSTQGWGGLSRVYWAGV